MSKFKVGDKVQWVPDQKERYSSGVVKTICDDGKAYVEIITDNGTKVESMQWIRDLTLTPKNNEKRNSN